MATIVYDGVGGGGNIFEGTKFCFLQRVPSRQRWIELVESNGGEIVKLEKQADIVIADHARKDCPAGSISWTYIEQSAKKGLLEDPEDHRAGPATHVTREVGSGQPTRKGRTRFTDEDDQILRKWVIEGQRAGIPIKGNELFIQLEKKNPRHTYQSWRDRWVKYVSQRAGPEPDEASPDGSPGPVRKASGPGSRTATHKERMTSMKPSSSRQSPPPESSITEPWVAKSAGGMVFSTKEIKLLNDHYDDIIGLDEDKQFDAWAAWAVEYPNHTPQEWRNYFVKDLRPLIDQQRMEQSKQATPPPETKRSEIIKSNPTTPTPAHDRPEQDNTPEPSFIEVPDSQPVGNGIIDAMMKDETLFRHYLSLLAKGFNLPPLEFSPMICGKQIPLFRLWQIVKSEFGGFDEVTGRGRWPMVARKFNFSDFQLRHASAAADLEACYKEILASFEEFSDELEKDNLTDSQEQLMLEVQLKIPTGIDQDEEEQELDEDDYDDDLNAPQSSPAQPISPAAKKRTMPDRGGRGGSSHSKRQRIDKGKGKEREIPSTPEDLINNNIQVAPYKPSPLKFGSPILDEQEDSEDLFMQPFKRPDLSFLEQRHPTLEPEAQDFHFPLQDDDEVGLHDSISSSPPRHKIQYLNGNLAAQQSVDDDSSTQSQTESQTEAQLLEYIDRHVALGYEQAVVIEALEATTMSTGDAGIVMESLTKGDGIPENIQGVWTALDDLALMVEGSEDYGRIMVKHGMKKISQRRKYLKDQEEARDLVDASLE